MAKKWSKAEEESLWGRRERMTAAELARKFAVTPAQIKKKLLELSRLKAKHPRVQPKNAKPVAPRPKKSASEERRKAIATEAERYAKTVGLFDRGVELFNTRKFEKAQRVFEEIVEKHAEEKEFLDRARLYLNLIQRQLRPAEPRLRTFEDFYNQAIYHINLGEYDKALIFLKKAAEKKPGDPSITYFIALAFAGKSDAKASLEHLRNAVRLDPENRVLARNESEFQPMLEDPEFRALLFAAKSGFDRPESA